MTRHAMTGRARLRLLAIVVAVMVVGTAAGTAAAFWRGPGTGTGSGATGATTAIALTAGSASADLYPGDSGIVSTIASNPNATSVRIGSIALDTARGTNGFAVDTAHIGCPASTFTFVSQTNGGTGWTISGSGSLAIALPGALTMSASAANACQGVVVTVYLKAQP